MIGVFYYWRKLWLCQKEDIRTRELTKDVLMML
jgi:hypothetical protein